MKVKASPLQILDFAVTEFDFKLITSGPPDESLEIGAFMSRYEVDVDFDIGSEDHIRVTMRASINKGEKQLPGYSISAEAVCFFSFDNELQIPEDARRAMGGFSTIYIALNSLRGLISGFTANAPFGRYILPSIDLNDLVRQKQSLLNPSETEPNKSLAPADSNVAVSKRPRRANKSTSSQ